MATTASELDKARGRIGALEALCAEMYQIAGTVGAPVAILDALWAASDGRPIPADLPIVLDTDCTAVREREDLIAQMRQLLGVSAAAELGRKGGAQTSKAKKRAARANGKKGGRPRKVLNVPFRLGAVPATAGASKKSMKIEY
ncbi:MAG: hypothetical protein ABIT71_24815 [Vicinamibacteraceae bacterium]